MKKSNFNKKEKNRSYPLLSKMQFKHWLVYILPVALLAAVVYTSCKKTLKPNTVDQQTDAQLKTNTDPADFTIAVLPDTQNYTALYTGGNMTMMSDQLHWIVDHKTSSNIVYVTQLGDLINDAFDSSKVDRQFARADTVIANTLEAASIPYGIAVGNHDENPKDDANGNSTAKFNQYFGPSRYSGRSYFGGVFRAGSNESHYDTFSGGGKNWMVIYLEFDADTGETNDHGRNDWAYNLLLNNPTKKGIVVTHFVGKSGTPTVISDQTTAIFNRLKTRPNLVMFIGGHDGNGVGEPGFHATPRTALGLNQVRFYVSDYQFLNNPNGSGNGGNGYMRLMRFSVAKDSVYVTTFSPYLEKRVKADSNQFKNDPNQQFRKPLFNN